MQKKKITIYLTEEVVLKLKLFSLQRGTNMSQTIQDLLEEKVKDVPINILGENKKKNV